MRRFCVTALLAGLTLFPALQASSSAATTDGAPSYVASSPIASSALPDCVLADNITFDPRPAIPVDIAQGGGSERRAALAQLIAAEQAFVRAVATDETDQGASDACQAHAAEAAERRIFLRTLERLVAGDASDAPLLTIQEADGALNGAYRDVMAVAEPGDLAWGSVDKAGIRRTERAWLAYRDAFVAFAATLGQPDAAERVKIELTARRATSLEAFLAD